MGDDAFIARRKAAARVAAAYQECSQCLGVALIGSVSCRHPDDYSDIDLIVLWSEMPRPEDRQQVILRLDSEIDINWSNATAHQDMKRLFVSSNGALGEIWPEKSTDPDNLRIRERYYIDGLKVGIIGLVYDELVVALGLHPSHFPISDGQSLLRNSIKHADPIYGAEVFARLKKKACIYPGTLQQSMVDSYGEVPETWWLRHALAARLDRLALRIVLDEMLTRIFRLILVLNSNNLPDTRFKWSEKRLLECKVLPEDCLSTFSKVLCSDPVNVIHEIDLLFMRTLELLESAGVAGDYEYLRARAVHAREEWRPQDSEQGFS